MSGNRNYKRVQSILLSALVLSLALYFVLAHPLISVAGEANDEGWRDRNSQEQLIASVVGDFSDNSQQSQDTIDQLTDGVQDTTGQLTDGVQDAIDQPSDDVQDTIDQLTDGVPDTIDQLTNGVRDTFGQLIDQLQESVEEVSELQAQKLARQQAQQKMQATFNRNVGAYLTLLDRITGDTPWLIRVNQTTCVVTIYRMLEVSPGEVVTKQALADLVRRNIISGEGEWVQAVHAVTVPEDSETENSDVVDIASEDSSSDGSASENVDSENSVLDGIISENDASEYSEAEGSTLDISVWESIPDTVTVWIPVYACPCSTGARGSETPTGTFYIQDHLRWHELIGPTWGQWCCHFAPSYLFHSLPYERPNDPNSLQGDFYNLIGQAVSHGCVRLTCMDAKYIYDNVPTGGKVEVFYGTEEDDPFGKPKRPYVGEWTKQYDPTDPEYKPESE